MRMVLGGPLSSMRCLPIFLSAMVLVLWTVEAAAAPEAGETRVYDIHHEDHGLVGHHKVSFEKDGADLVVAVENQIKVKVLFITAYRFEAMRRERWHDGKMVAYATSIARAPTETRRSAVAADIPIPTSLTITGYFTY